MTKPRAIGLLAVLVVVLIGWGRLAYRQAIVQHATTLPGHVTLENGAPDKDFHCRRDGVDVFSVGPIVGTYDPVGDPYDWKRSVRGEPMAVWEARCTLKAAGSTLEWTYR